MDAYLWMCVSGYLSWTYMWDSWSLQKIKIPGHRIYNPLPNFAASVSQEGCCGTERWKQSSWSA